MRAASKVGGNTSYTCGPDGGGEFSLRGVGAAGDTDESNGVDSSDSENTGFIHNLCLLYPLGALRRSWGDKRRGLFRAAANFSRHLSVDIQRGSDIGTDTS